MNQSVQDLVRRVKEHLQALYGERLKQVILYGSQIRGEATEASDIDLLVLVDESLDPFEVRCRLGEILFDILLDRNR
ncbi:MAG: nucleotidyltransferase domain-containing protein [Candidatus Methanospirareceae archaeon]